MINTILFIVKMLIAILPFVVLCIVNRKVNLPQIERNKQYLMPVITLVYLILSASLMTFIDNLILGFFDKLPGWISSVSDISWMPDKIGAFFTTIGDYVGKFFQSLNLHFWVFFLTNTVIIILYLIIKKISIKIISKSVNTEGGLHTTVSEKFYEFFPEKSVWCIRDEYIQIRSLLKVFYYSAVVISALLMIISHKFYFNGMMRSVFYPVFGILIVGELYFFLDGVSRTEYVSEILGEDEDAYKVVNYSLLRKFLRSVFGDKLLSENTSVNNTLTYDVTTEEVVRELENDEDSVISTFASYIDAYNKSGEQIDHNYVRSAIDLLKGKSILFNNPFYNDLIPYAFYPMNRALLCHKKVLIVLGRHAIEEDIKEWVEKGIEAVTNIPYMWNVGILNKEEQDLDIGIITRSDILDIELHNTNASFLEKVGFVVVIEPSKLISTAQIGLNLLVKKCRNNEDKNIVYCLCDKNCDGLVDAMSHILMTSITEVSATEKHLGTSSYMCWETGEEYLHHRLVPNISRYLGVGTELSFAALKNQVSKTKWYGGEAFPVTDMRWIAKQYYYDLTKYANLPTSQQAMDEYFVTTPNFWSAEVDKNNYFTVEDEQNNMFEILREFATRTKEQGFINIVSPEYILKDYMADNASIFEADAKAIPYIVSDFTRSNRNTIFRLILMMSTYPVNEDVLRKELSLLGINVFDLKKQLWYELYCCYSETSAISLLPEDYVEAVEEVYTRKLSLSGAEWTHDIIVIDDNFSMSTGKIETTYSVTDPDFLKICVSELRSAGYVAEDERGQRYYLGAELSSQIYQKYLPGQFFTFGGKYYEMQYLTADGQVLVRRAADHINGRPAYRQIREYVIHSTRPSEKIGAQQDIAGMKIVKEFADISVITPGYYLMDKYNDFSSARKVSFEGEKNGIPKRIYRNKEILRIELPDFGDKLNDKIRYTITSLFNEVFVTLFAENQPYICALTDAQFLSEYKGVDPNTYTIRGEEYEIKKNTIYIIEDSQLDLGLTVAVERNLQRIFRIVFDYLDWHKENLTDSVEPPEDPKPPVSFEKPEGYTDPKDPKKPKDPENPDNTSDKKEDEKPQKGIKGVFSKIGKGFKKIFSKIAGLFKKKPKDESETEESDGKKKPKKEKKPKKAKKGKKKKNDTPVENETPVDNQTPTENIPEENPALPEGEVAPVEEIPEVEIPEVDIPETDYPSEETPESEEAPLELPPSDESSEGTTPEVKTPSDDGADTPADGENDGAQSTGSPDLSNSSGNIGVSVMKVKALNSPLKNESLTANNIGNGGVPGLMSERKPYHERYYLLYGGKSEPECMDYSAAFEYLSEMGLQRNALKQAREGKKIAEFIEATFTPGKPDARYCDFCGTEIYGVEYETLSDGRDRCLHCSRTAVKTESEFRKIFEDVKRNMESFFGIRIDVGIKVEMVNSAKLHKRLGKAFIPTPQSDGRVLGVAIKDKGGYRLMIENGSPRMKSMLTMAHELTHIWQYVNWKDKAICKKYGKKMRLEIYEGMAKWVEIQYAYLINEPATAKREEIYTSIRNDEYGRGFLRYRVNYPFSLGTVITRPTPFMNIDTPLDPQYCGNIYYIPPVLPGVPTGEPEEEGAKLPVPPAPVPGPIVNPDGDTTRDPDNLSRYAFNLLREDEKVVYNTVLSAINAFAPEVSQFGTSVTEPQLKMIVDYVMRDHPELIWFQHGSTFYFDPTTQIVSRLSLRYCMSQEEAVRRQSEINASLESFVSSVDPSLGDYDLTLKIYENIIDLVDYDTIGLERQNGNRIVDPEVPDDLRSIYGVFVNKKAVCAGYAKAMQYLLNMYGVECTYVTSSTHAWNLLKVEGDYYHMDVTWGDGTDTKAEKNQLSKINYDCFCITTAEVLRLKEHEPEASLPLPECTATKCNYHIRNGLYFESYDADRIKSIVCDNVKAGKLDVSIKFATAELYLLAKKSLIDNGTFSAIISDAAHKAGVKLSTSYQYVLSEEKLTLAFFLSEQ